MTDSDKKALLWLGAVLVAFAIVIARLITGTWYGIFMGVAYALMWVWPVVAGLPDADRSGREERLVEKVSENEAEIARLRKQLAATHDKSTSA